MLRKLPPAVLMVIALLGPFSFGLFLVFVTRLVPLPASLKTVPFWLPVGLAAASLAAAAAAKPWFPRWPRFFDVGVRVVATTALFFLFIFLFGLWAAGAMVAGIRTRTFFLSW